MKFHFVSFVSLLGSLSQPSVGIAQQITQPNNTTNSNQYIWIDAQTVIPMSFLDFQHQVETNSEALKPILTKCGFGIDTDIKAVVLDKQGFEFITKDNVIDKVILNLKLKSNDNSIFKSKLILPIEMFQIPVQLPIEIKRSYEAFQNELKTINNDQLINQLSKYGFKFDWINQLQVLESKLLSEPRIIIIKFDCLINNQYHYQPTVKLDFNQVQFLKPITNQPEIQNLGIEVAIGLGIALVIGVSSLIVSIALKIKAYQRTKVTKQD